MADVTGELGSERIRLRGMALEETQYLIYQQLVEIGDELHKDAVRRGSDSKKKKDFDKAEEERERRKEKREGAARRITDAVMASSSKFGEVIKKAGDKVATFTEVFGRITRGYDSSIRDTSYVFRQLGMHGKGFGSWMAKFAGESVAQLEEQFDVYKRINDVGGAFASDFDDLKIKANEMGISMSEYAQLVSTNVENLRMGGTGVRTSLERLNKGVKNLRDGGDELNDQFMRMGISSHDYAQMVLEQTQIMGGFGKVTDTSSKTFQEQMLKAAKVTQSLSEVFGTSKDEINKKTANIMKDPVNRAIIEGIKKDFGDAKITEELKGFTAAFQDEGMAMEIMIAKYRGAFSEGLGGMLSLNSELMDGVSIIAEELGKDSSVEGLRKARERVGAKTFDSIYEQLSEVALTAKLTGGDLLKSITPMLGLLQRMGNLDKAVDNLNNATNNQTGAAGENLDALGKLQRQNIDIAIEFAQTAKAVNNFGLTAAFATQMLARAMSALASGSMSKVEDIVKEYGGHKAIRDTSKVSQDLIDRLKKQGFDEAIENLYDERNNNRRPVSDSPLYGKVFGDKDITVKGKTVKASRVDEARTEATRGGPTNLFMKQAAAWLADMDPDVKFNAFQDTYEKRKHGEFSVDFGIKGGKDAGAAYKQKLEAQLKALGLSPSDYLIKDEYNDPSPNANGGHMHLQFNSRDAAEKFYKNYGEKYEKDHAPNQDKPKVSFVPTPSTLKLASNTGSTTEFKENSTNTGGATITTGLNNNGIGSSYDQSIILSQILDEFKRFSSTMESEGTATRRVIDDSMGRIADAGAMLRDSTT